MGFGAFAVGTCELVLAGVLADLSATFGVPVGVGGQVVTAFGLTCAVLAPVLATASARWPRRQVLLGAIGLYLLGVLATALAPSFTAVLAAQMVAAAGAGLFLPTATVTASAVVAPHRRGRAIAVVTTGMTAATALGAPLGTAIGGIAGWRATMWFVAALAGAAAIALAVVVPGALPVSTPEGLRARLRPLARTPVLLLLGTTLLAFTAVYIPYTYISVVFAEATSGSGVLLAVLMAVLGVVGVVGNLGAGALADRFGGRAIVGTALIGVTGALLLMPAASTTLPTAIAVIAGYGLVGFAISTPQTHRLITTDPDSAAVLVALNAAALYLAISSSGAVGAAGLGVVGAGGLGPLAAVFAVLALAVSEAAHRLSRQRAGTAG
ncbi:MFS transporter [Saccharopolyspora montiporae]|uniref:MFS transporter n=1 Tax=Saccharopolyspora montiporae TaxID=2781240 RepID=UPI001D132CD9|nr:MFS transporter [Saccharopolyspora sp. HNM0983]